MGYYKRGTPTTTRDEAIRQIAAAWSAVRVLNGLTPEHAAALARAASTYDEQARRTR